MDWFVRIRFSSPNKWFKRERGLIEIPTIVAVVAVALIDESGRVLLQQRRVGRRLGGLWEFPGGKVEAGESLESALQREIAEELGIGIDPARLEPLSFAAAPGDPHVVLLYTCRAWIGEVQCLDAAALGWYGAAELTSVPLVPLDLPLACALRAVLEAGK
jgi:8-oxo-dGTP diphosphatase